MTTSADGAFADAVLAEANRQAAADPAVRRADFRYDVVTAVNTDGTVSVGDVRARRYTAYTAPAVGDQVVLLQSGNRNWIALGRLAPATDTGTWTTLTLAAGFAHPGHGYLPGWMKEGKRVWLRGRAGVTSGSITNGATIATLPTNIRPAGNLEFGWAAPRGQISTAPSVTRAEIAPGGILRIYEAFNLPAWISLDGVTYLTD